MIQMKNAERDQGALLPAKDLGKSWISSIITGPQIAANINLYRTFLTVNYKKKCKP